VHLFRERHACGLLLGGLVRALAPSRKRPTNRLVFGTIDLPGRTLLERVAFLIALWAVQLQRTLDVRQVPRRCLLWMFIMMLTCVTGVRYA
jgi:hypothetical protein